MPKPENGRKVGKMPQEKTTFPVVIAGGVKMLVVVGGVDLSGQIGWRSQVGVGKCPKILRQQRKPKNKVAMPAEIAVMPELEIGLDQ